MKARGHCGVFSLLLATVAFNEFLAVSAYSASFARAAGLDSIAPWRYSQYPSPFEYPTVCRTTSEKLCDPDGILNDSEVERVDRVLKTSREFVLPCKAESNVEGIKGRVINIEIAVALVKKMDLLEFEMNSKQHERAAEVFARSLHNEWGVGVTNSCGGTGILLFLSDLDRVIYVSRGTALKTILTDRRLDRAMNKMKPLLQEKKFEEAILSAVEEFEFLIQYGKPHTWELINDYITRYGGLCWVAVFLVFAGRNIHVQTKKQREYAKVRSHLSEMDRARAEALQGRFCATSCPICLEPFPDHATTSIRTPEQLGSDNLPIKLLRCGHVFDHNCWLEWASKGQGQVTKCPICQQDVGMGEDLTTARNTQSLSRRSSRVVNDDLDDSIGHRGLAAEGERFLNLHNRERSFRLTQLGYQFPQIIGPHQIQQWSQNDYNGMLVQDPTFISSDPVSGVGSSARGVGIKSSFSGGSSGGGRCGRW